MLFCRLVVSRYCCCATYLEDLNNFETYNIHCIKSYSNNFNCMCGLGNVVRGWVL